MGKLSSRRIEARDRRAAAVHEAGHFVMARHFHIVGDDEVVADLFPRLRIWRSATMDSCFEKTWIGQCRGLDLRSLGETEPRMFGIAGYVAEAI